MRTDGQVARAASALLLKHPDVNLTLFLRRLQQHLLVTAGVGRTGEWEGRVEEIKAGDVIWCPPEVKHWHGATPTTAMTHNALTGTFNGKSVEWMEKVSDEQYNGK